MNRLTAKKISNFTMILGIALAALSFLGEAQMGELLSNILFGAAILIVVVGAILNIRFWRCPHCGFPLPQYSLVKNNEDFKCDRCGKKINEE